MNIFGKKTNIVGLVLVLVATALPSSNTFAASQDLASWEGTWATATTLPEEAKKFSDPGAACCFGPAADVPLTPKFRAMRDAFVNRKDPAASTVTNSSSCTPPGMPGVLVHPILFEFLFTAGRVTMIFDNGEVRRIWLDGRKHTPADELEATYEGESIGKWEKSTLVVDTIGIFPLADVFMANGIHVTPNTRVVERMRLLDKETLEIDFTVHDAEIFTTPYHYDIRYKKIPGTFIVGCDAHNRDDGVKPVDLTPPL